MNAAEVPISPTVAADLKRRGIFKPRPCGATRPPVQDAGWECNGTGLVVVTTMGDEKLPVVLPRRALEIIDPDPWWDLPVQDFTGGDHAHLVVPRRPDGFKGDSLFLFGSSAVPFKMIGHIHDEPGSYVFSTIETGQPLDRTDTAEHMDPLRWQRREGLDT